MARDVFAREVEIGTPLAADATRLLFAGDSAGDGLLVQNIAVNYQQNITRLWEVGSPQTFFFAGRTQGTIQMKKVVGGNGVSREFITKYGDVCEIRENHLTFLLIAACASGDLGGADNIKASGCVINSLTYSVASADMIINEEMSLLFALLTNV
jgi:hypothetical protein